MAITINIDNSKKAHSQVLKDEKRLNERKALLTKKGAKSFECVYLDKGKPRSFING